MEEHGRPIGAPTRDDLLRRAREIAETNGRRPQNYTESDLQQAKEELLGLSSSSTPEDEEALSQATEWSEIVDPVPHKSAANNPLEEQTPAERLIEEGVEEAAHDQMVAGNRLSRATDRL